MFLTCASVPLPEMTTCCMCQKEIHLLVSAGMSAAGVSSTVRVSKGFNVSVVFLHFIITDPQNEAKITSDPLAAHTDWLTLNIGGRLFTTTRYLRFKFSFHAISHSLFLCSLVAECIFFYNQEHLGQQGAGEYARSHVSREGYWDQLINEHFSSYSAMLLSKFRQALCCVCFQMCGETNRTSMGLTSLTAALSTLSLFSTTWDTVSSLSMKA